MSMPVYYEEDSDRQENHQSCQHPHHYGHVQGVLLVRRGDRQVLASLYLRFVLPTGRFEDLGRVVALRNICQLQ